MERIVVDVTTGEQRIVPLTPEEIAELNNHKEIPPTVEQQRARRAVAYSVEADPLFFKAQRGAATMEEWQDKIKEIQERYPLPT